MLAARNGLVHLPSFVDGKECCRPHTPLFFSPTVLDFDFNADAPEPVGWLKFLRKLWDTEADCISLLQEWFGYCLLPDTRQQKMLSLVGPPRSGKGTIARVLHGLIGMRNTAGPTLASLGTTFGLWPLLGKSIAIISDARLSARSDTAVVVERLLSISGEDAQTIDRKYLTPVTCKLPTRFVILTNELPRLNDASGARASRMLMLPMTTSWLGKEDTTLTDRLLAELPGILLWAVEGWKRLRDRGHFVQAEAGRTLVQALEELTSPMLAFVRERCEVGPCCNISVAELYSAWCRWCDDKGRKECGTEQTFGRDLHAAAPTVKVRQCCENGWRYRLYEGIQLAEATRDFSDLSGR